MLPLQPWEGKDSQGSGAGVLPLQPWGTQGSDEGVLRLDIRDDPETQIEAALAFLRLRL